MICTRCDDTIHPGARHVELCAVETCGCGCGGEKRVGIVQFCSMECLTEWTIATPVRCGTCEHCLAEKQAQNRSLS